eukprot:GHVU01198095.1.p3 GENE.GHVU01198095.1~~GHVU01198095.1.p3  ORF type:complete len:119 (-),score=18.96 GHVU01198095.1:190-546(-)
MVSHGRGYVIGAMRQLRAAAVARSAMTRQFHAAVAARSPLEQSQHSKVPRPGEELGLESIILPPKPEAAQAEAVEQRAQEPINSDRTHQPLSQVIPLKSRAEYKKILSAFNARGGAKN